MYYCFLVFCRTGEYISLDLFYVKRQANVGVGWGLWDDVWKKRKKKECVGCVVTYH